MDPQLAILCLGAAGRKNSRGMEGPYTRHARMTKGIGVETMMEKRIDQIEFAGVEVLAFT